MILTAEQRIARARRRYRFRAPQITPTALLAAAVFIFSAWMIFEGRVVIQEAIYQIAGWS